MKRHFLAVAGLALVVALTLGGCAGSADPDVKVVGPQLQSAVLAVDGVTGGTVEFYYASLSPRVVCKLTGSGVEASELAGTLDRVLRARASTESGSCSTTSGAPTGLLRRTNSDSPGSTRSVT